MTEDERDWDEVERRAVAGLEPVAFLVGSWVGAGTAYGRPLRGHLVGSRSLRGSWLEVHERLLGEGGSVDHEDRHFYRYDVEAQQLKVLHLMAPGQVVDCTVVAPDPVAGAPLGERRFRWYAGPFAPRIDHHWDGVNLDVVVTLPFEPEPSSTMRYQRVESPA